MRKIGGLIMICIAAFFLYAIVKGAVGLPETQKRLSEAEFLSDGVQHPELEGQLVIVSGTLTSDGNAYDDELKLTMPSPLAVRYVEILKYKTDADGKGYLTWVPVRSEQEDEWLREKKLTANLSLGGYQLDAELVKMLSGGKEVSYSMLNSDELAELQTHNIELIEYGGVCYLSEAPRSTFGEKITSRSLFKYETYRRVHYRMMDPQGDMQMCIAGKISGDTLMRDATLDTRPIYEDAVQKSDVVQQNSLFTILGMVIVGIICLGLIFAGGAMVAM